MRNGAVLFKQLFSIPAVALIAIVSISSCQKDATTSSTAGVGDWAHGADFAGTPRTEAASFTIGTDIYVGGGFDNSSNNLRRNDFYKFNETQAPFGNWTQIADFAGTARSSAVGFTINGKGYIGTGYDGTNMLKDFWEYTPGGGGGTWTQVDNFPGKARYDAVGFTLTINGKQYGYVGSGYDSNYTSDFYQFDPTAAPGSQWTAITDIPTKRTAASAFVYNNIAYVVGGTDNGTYKNDLWSLDSTLTWKKKRGITDLNDSSYDASYGNAITRNNAASFLINDTAYLVGGNFNGTIGSCWGYDIGNDQWFVKTPFEGIAREGGIGFTVNNHGYVTTGVNGSEYFDDTWEFLPDLAVTPNDN